MGLFPFSKKKKTGTTSRISELRSPYIKKPSLPTKFFKRGKRKKILAVPSIQPKSFSKIKRFFIILGSLAAIGGLVYLIGFSHFFDVKSWEIYEDKTKITNDDAVNELLKKQKNKNLFFIDENQISKDIKAIHPEYEKIMVEKVFPQKIKVQITEYPIIANIVNVVQGIQKKFVMNSQGFLTDENTENPELPYIKVFTNNVFSVHTTIIDQDKLNYIINAINLFQEKFNMKVLNAEYHVREREVHLQTEKSFFVWLDMEKDANAQLEKLKKVVPKLDIYHTPLEYIDLRIDGTDNQKVIFKPKT